MQKTKYWSKFINIVCHISYHLNCYNFTIQLVFYYNLIFRFLYHDQITCIYFTRVIFGSHIRFDKSINKFKIYDCSYEFITWRPTWGGELRPFQDDGNGGTSMITSKARGK